jgi:hypothetical protein
VLLVALLRLGLMIVWLHTKNVSTREILENTLVAGLLIWESSRAVVLYFHRRYPLGQSNARRYWQEAGMLVADGLFYLGRPVLFMNLFSQAGPPQPIFHLFGLLYTLLYGMLAAAFYELLIYMEAWKLSMASLSRASGWWWATTPSPSAPRCLPAAWAWPTLPPSTNCSTNPKYGCSRNPAGSRWAFRSSSPYPPEKYPNKPYNPSPLGLELLLALVFGTPGNRCVVKSTKDGYFPGIHTWITVYD